MVSSEKNLAINIPYYEARKIILASGWMPVKGKTPDEHIGIPALVFREKGYWEVDDCSGTGMGYCTFYFKNDKDEYLKVGTQGGSTSTIVINYEIKDAL